MNDENLTLQRKMFFHAYILIPFQGSKLTISYIFLSYYLLSMLNRIWNTYCACKCCCIEKVILVETDYWRYISKCLLPNLVMISFIVDYVMAYFIIFTKWVKMKNILTQFEIKHYGQTDLDLGYNHQRWGENGRVCPCKDMPCHFHIIFDNCFLKLNLSNMLYVLKHKITNHPLCLMFKYCTKTQSKIDHTPNWSSVNTRLIWVKDIVFTDEPLFN